MKSGKANTYAKLVVDRAIEEAGLAPQGRRSPCRVSASSTASIADAFRSATTASRLCSAPRRLFRRLTHTVNFSTSSATPSPPSLSAASFFFSAAARAFFAFFLKSAKHFANLAQKTSTSSRVVPNAAAAVK